MALNVSARPVGAFKPLDDDARGKVLAQVEFYFSDSNLPRDKFLRETVEADPDGFVDIALLATFSRMRALLAPFGGPHNEETIAALTDLLRTSETLSVSDDAKRIRRTAELRPREEVDAEVEKRSVYSSPFPMTATIDDITEFFARHVKVRSVRLRRHITSKDFKGSVFVELENAAACDTLINGDKLEYEGAEQIIMMKREYLDKKKTERVEKAAANAAAKAEAAAAAAAATPPAEEEATAAADAPKANEDANEPVGEPAAPSFTEGLILKFVLGEGAEDGVRREDFSAALSGFGAVKFIDFKMGQTSGCVRFEDADAVKKIIEAHGVNAGVPLEIGGKPATLSVMEGDEEAAYWKALASMSGGGGRGGGRGGSRGGGRGGGRGGRGRGVRRDGRGNKRGNDGGGGGGKRARQ
jgi:lupus La protein